jgi:DNA polymerase type B, organellar and viral
MNYLSKILLNNLYGRFGMNDEFNNLLIINKEEMLEIEENNFQIENIVQLS